MGLSSKICFASALYTPECVGIIARSFVRRRKIQMPSKKPNKAAKRPGKATPKKATHKAAAPKKAARPPTKAKPIATSKVTVKPTKPAPKPVSAKPAITKPPRAKPAALKPVPTPAPKVHSRKNCAREIRSPPARDAAARAAKRRRRRCRGFGVRQLVGGSAQCEALHCPPRRAIHEQGAVGALRSHSAELGSETSWWRSIAPCCT